MSNYLPLHERAYLYIKQLLLDQQLEYGTIYSEAAMAQNIGISRTPFKQALVRLSDAQLIDIIPSKGFCLHEFTEDDVRSLFEMRYAIENYSAQHLWRIRDTEQGRKAIQTLQDASAKMRLTDCNDPKSYVDLDIGFHKALIASCNNHLFNKTFESFCIWISIFARGCLFFRKEEANGEHLAIIDAISSGSSADCEAAISQHLKRSEIASMQNFIESVTPNLRKSAAALQE